MFNSKKPIIIMIKSIIKRIIPPSTWERIRVLKRRLIHFYLCVIVRVNRFKLHDGKYMFADILSITSHHVFFGYYDLSQMDNDEKKLLVHIANQKSNPQCDPIKICTYNLVEKKYEIITQSFAWSWQQGCRLRWNPVDSSQIMFNNCVDGKYVCEIWDTNKKCRVREIPIALYDIDSNLAYGYGVNFSRLQRLRPGYGYSSLPDSTKGQRIPLNDGIFRYDFRKDEVKLIISYERLCEDFSDNLYEHYINHISVSPDGSRFMFFHLWSLGDVNKWKMRLYVSDQEGKELKLLEETDVISHYTWKDNKTILTTKINNDSKETCYYQYEIENGRKLSVKESHLYLDGHPTYLKDGKAFISDTYPQPDNFQHLFCIDTESDRYYPILDIYHDPRMYGEKRCDLHPRVSKSNNYITIDTTYKGGSRSVVILKTKCETI